MRAKKGSSQLTQRKSGRVSKGADSGSQGKSHGRKQTASATGRQRKSKETRNTQSAQTKTANESKGKGRKGTGVRAATGRSRSKGTGQQAKTVAVKDLKQASRRSKQTTRGRKEAAPTKGARSVKVELAKQKKAGQRKTQRKQQQKKAATQKGHAKAEKEKEAQEALVRRGIDQLRAQEEESKGNTSFSPSVVTRNVRKRLMEPIKSAKNNAGADGKDAGSANGDSPVKLQDTAAADQEALNLSALLKYGIDQDNLNGQLGAFQKLHKHIESGQLSESNIVEIFRNGFVRCVGKINTLWDDPDEKKLKLAANACLRSFYCRYRQSFDINLPSDTKLTLDLAEDNSSSDNENLPCLPIIHRLLYSSKEDVLADASHALQCICDASQTFTQKVLDSGVCQRLVDLLSHTSDYVLEHAVSAVGNIVYGNDDQTQVVVDCSGVRQLNQLLSNSHHTIRKLACWTLSNMAAGTKAQIQAMIDANVIPAVIELFKDTVLLVQKEAFWVIVQITAGNTASIQQIRHVAKLGWVKPFCSNLDSEDRELLRISLEALLALLNKLGEKKKKKGRGKAGLYSEEIKACGGVDKIKKLKNHSDDDISKNARDIMVYF
ncbi:uncharacterized protein [Diadema setosum]|uniref:uncharacterized protein n=1 Tax=Diadema setosum TaxID=31175 RepID=UPI003B3B6968